MTATAQAPSAPTGDAPRRVPFARTIISDEALQRAHEVLASGWVTTGPETVAFERELAAYLGAPDAVAVSSCTVAIELALRALALRPGSLVLTPTITFCGAVHAIVHAGLRPVLVDVDPVTLIPRPDQVMRAVEGRTVAAMVVQHMAGHPAQVRDLAEAAGLPLDRVVEDAAHGLGAVADDEPIGTISGATCFSFYATKNLPIGEGGAVTTADPDRAAFLRRARLHGMTADAWRRYLPGGGWAYSVDVAGLKANMTDVQAAIGRAQLVCFDEWQRVRAELAEEYDALLGQVEGVALPARPRSGRHAWHLYIVRLDPVLGPGRDAMAAELATRGVATSVHFIPVHSFPYFRTLLGEDECARFPEADAVFPTLLTLPLHAAMDLDDVRYVCEQIADICQSADAERVGSGGLR